MLREGTVQARGEPQAVQVTIDRTALVFPRRNAQDRFARVLTSWCRIARLAIRTARSNQDLVLDDAVLTYQGVRCCLLPLSTSDDMLAAGPLERQYYRLLLPAGTAVRPRDVVEIDGELWSVTEPEQTIPYWGVPHHVEVLVQRRAVQG